MAEGGEFELSLYRFGATTFSKLQVLSAQMFSVSAERRSGVSISATQSGISNPTSIFHASGLQLRFAIQARHRTRGPFSFKNGTAAVAFREFGNECGVLAVNLFL